MEPIWGEMFQAAKAVQNGRKISDYIEAGGVYAMIGIRQLQERSVTDAKHTVRRYPGANDFLH